MLELLPFCAFARTIPEMVREGWLAPLTWQPVQIDLDLEQVAIIRKTGGLDYAEATLARHLLREDITTRVVECAAALMIAQPTLSPGLYTQMLGRGMRTADGKNRLPGDRCDGQSA